MKVESSVVPDAVEAWHALDAAEVERLLDTGGHGLNAAEVQARLRHHGPNQLEEEPPPRRLGWPSRR